MTFSALSAITVDARIVKTAALKILIVYVGLIVNYSKGCKSLGCQLLENPSKLSHSHCLPSRNDYRDKRLRLIRNNSTKANAGRDR